MKYYDNGIYPIALVLSNDIESVRKKYLLYNDEYDEIDEYYVMETKAPRGYDINTNKFEVKPSGDKDSLGTDVIKISILDGMINIPNQIYVDENIRKSEKFVRSGDFIEHFASHNWLEICRRYLNLASFEEMIKKEILALAFINKNDLPNEFDLNGLNVKLDVEKA